MARFGKPDDSATAAQRKEQENRLIPYTWDLSQVLSQITLENHTVSFHILRNTRMVGVIVIPGDLFSGIEQVVNLNLIPAIQDTAELWLNQYEPEFAGDSCEIRAEGPFGETWVIIAALTANILVITVERGNE